MSGVVEQDVIYHRPQGIDLLARLYRPEGPGPFAGVVGVHGGRWCAETRLTNHEMDRALAATGVVVMAIDFRMPPVVRFPYPVADINFAIRWLRAHAVELDIDPQGIGGVGTSSGGHQLLLNALLPNDPRFQLDHDPSLEAVDPGLRFLVACWPVADPLARYRYAIEQGMDIHVASHDAYWRDEAQMQSGSPQHIVSQRAAECLPPLLLIQGGKDIILAPGMSEHFAEAYGAAGGLVEIKLFPDEGHTFITKAPTTPAARDAIKSICDFVHAQTDGIVQQSGGGQGLETGD